MTKQQPSSGFTIVELLIVVVVIAILAVITIIGFNGIQGRAVETSLKADLKSASQQIENDKTITGSYPANVFTANSGKGIKTSSSNSLVYAPRSTGYCIAISRQSKSFYFSSTNGSIASGQCPISNEGLVSTFAGGSPVASYGYVDGPVSNARFASPGGVDIDSSGNIYIADTENNRIRKIGTDGIVSTVAGSGTEGYANGSSASAQFARPYDVAVGSDGVLYVADTFNYRIRKIATDGTVSLLAGSGTSGFANGSGATAQFQMVEGIDVDTAGNVYVADSDGQRIRKITPSGVVSTLAGSGYTDSDTGEGSFANGTGTAAAFNFPTDVSLDTAGNVYVGDYLNCLVRKITPAGVVTTFAGTLNSGGVVDGTGTAAKFISPAGMAVDKDNNVYVADDAGNVRKITSAGVVTTVAGPTSYAGGYVNGLGSTARFNGIRSIAVDAAGGLYVADYGNYAIRKIQ